MATRSTAASAGQNDGVFWFKVEGLPRRYTWQDLKDLVRTQAAHGIRTEIHSSLDATGCSTGVVRLIRKDETRNLYQYLTSILIENRRLRVHLYDLSVPEAQRCISCNCGPELSLTCPRRRGSSAPAPAHSSFPCVTNAGPMLVNMGRPVMMTTSFNEPVTPIACMPMASTVSRVGPGQLAMAMSRMTLDPYAADHVEYAQPVFRQAPQAQPVRQVSVGYPLYMQNASGTPVNAAHGVVKTEARGVFVSGLKYKATTGEVRDHFSQVGDVVKVDLHKDPKTKKSKGYATILYANVETAQRAIEVFDQAEFMGMTLKVRLDKETTAIGASFPPSKSGRTKCPLIVNGTSAGAEQLRKDSPLASD